MIAVLAALAALVSGGPFKLGHVCTKKGDFLQPADILIALQVEITPPLANPLRFPAVEREALDLPPALRACGVSGEEKRSVGADGTKAAVTPPPIPPGASSEGERVAAGVLPA